MAAGIGEASAILAVAQLGISLSNTLIAYIADVKDASSRIQRVGNEILTTSERLKEIGELIDNNQRTQIFSVEGVKSARRCSNECENIITEVKAIIQKGGLHLKSDDLEKYEIDASLFSTLRWPFLKIKLEVPRAELQRVKIDLTLLFSSAMALGASTTAEKRKFRSDIPGLQRTKDWATHRLEQAKKRAQEPHRYHRSRKRSEAHVMDDEAELLQEFVEFQERRAQEEEEQKTRDRIALARVEEDKKALEEKRKRENIEKNAVEKYRKEQELLQAHTTEQKEAFGKELERLGFSSQQIESIFESPNLSFIQRHNSFRVPSGIPNDSSPQRPDSSLAANFQANPESPLGSKPKSLFHRRRWRSSSAQTLQEPRSSPLNQIRSEKPGAIKSSSSIEVWLLDMLSGQKMEVSPSENWVLTKSKELKKSQDVWQRFALLKPSWRNSIIDLLRTRNQDEDRLHPWVLYHFETPKRQRRAILLGQMYEDQLLQLILYKQDRTNQEKSDSQQKKKGHNLSASASPFPIPRVSANKSPLDPSLAAQDANNGINSHKNPSKSANTPNELENFHQTRVSFADNTNGGESQKLEAQFGSNSSSSPLSNGLTSHALTENTAKVTVHIRKSSSGSGSAYGITSIPIDIITLDAIALVDSPHYVHSKSSHDGSQKSSFLIIEKLLSISEVQALIDFTREKMEKGDIPWKPKRVLEYTEILNSENEPAILEFLTDDDDHNIPATLHNARNERLGRRRSYYGSPVRDQIDVNNEKPPYLMPYQREPTYYSHGDLSREIGKGRVRYTAPIESSLTRRRQRGENPYYSEFLYPLEPRGSILINPQHPLNRPYPRNRVWPDSRPSGASRRERRPLEWSESDSSEVEREVLGRERLRSGKRGNDKVQEHTRWDENPFRYNSSEARIGITPRQRSFERRKPTGQRADMEWPYDDSEGYTTQERRGRSSYPDRSETYRGTIYLRDYRDYEQDRSLHKVTRDQKSGKTMRWQSPPPSPPSKSIPARRPSRHFDYDDRSDESSEDDDESLRLTKRSETRKTQAQEPEYDDEEVIMKTLKQFTTIGKNEIPEIPPPIQFSETEAPVTAPHWSFPPQRSNTIETQPELDKPPLIVDGPEESSEAGKNTSREGFWVMSLGGGGGVRDDDDLKFTSHKTGSAVETLSDHDDGEDYSEERESIKEDSRKPTIEDG